MDFIRMNGGFNDFFTVVDDDFGDDFGDDFDDDTDDDDSDDVHNDSVGGKVLLLKVCLLLDMDVIGLRIHVMKFHLLMCVAFVAVLQFLLLHDGGDDEIDSILFDGTSRESESHLSTFLCSSLYSLVSSFTSISEGEDDGIIDARE